MPPTPSKVVLITGCSSGIGAATARHLAHLGWTVYATARRPETLRDLEAAGCRALALDVTDEDSMQAAVAAVEADHGAVGVLVNNAGYGQTGAIETVSLDQVRAQFETNVFGLVRMCQLVLPGMRAQRWGKIVNVSSMGGRFTFPGAGHYHASKHAVEAISDALRFEVRAFGVDVIVVEPGIILTGFGEHARPGAKGDGPYADFDAAVKTAYVETYEKGLLRRLGGPPETVARRIAKAITASRPRARYTVTASARALIAQKAVLPDAGWDAVMRTTFPSPGPD
jgi:NAD(P)-dependent dehydrogenase (short-subunit alcohol dehydrogenase family)